MCVEQDDPWKVHFILNSKGGVGKSFIAFLLAQYYRQRDAPIVCFDADATTSTFSSFAALNVTRIELMQGPRIDERRFDLILEKVLTDAAHGVIDTGTSSYVSLSNYLIENDVHRQIAVMGKQVVVHAIIVGSGRTLLETLNDLDDLATQLPEEVTLIVWLNEHFGAIGENGKSFTEMEVYRRHLSRIHAVFRLPQRTPATFGADLAQMMKQHLTFAEAIASPDFSIMARQRLTQMRRDIFAQMDGAL